MKKEELTKLRYGLQKLLYFTLHVRNTHDIGPHPIRAEAVDMTEVAKELIASVTHDTN